MISSLYVCLNWSLVIGHGKVKANHSFSISTSGKMIIMHWLPQLCVGLIFCIFWKSTKQFCRERSLIIRTYKQCKLNVLQCLILMYLTRCSLCRLWNLILCLKHNFSINLTYCGCWWSLIFEFPSIPFRLWLSFFL